MPRIYGRDAEIATLVEALDLAASGRLAVVLIEGEAGIGKSRLLEEALESARGRGIQVTAGRAEEFQQTRPFSVVADAFGCVRSSPDPRRAAIARLLAGGGLGEREPITVTSDQGLRFRVIDAFADLAEELALSGPLVLGVDDLQWGDPSSLLTLGTLSRRLAYLPFALVGCFRLSPSLKMVRQGAALTLGLRAYFYLALAQYLAGQWDQVLLTAEQGFSAATIHSRRFERPLLHLAAGCVPAGRGATEEAEQHARLAEQAAASLDYGQERVYAAMARALVCQAAGDYLGMADALGPWRDDSALDGRSRVYAVLWRPLLAEGLIGSGQAEPAAAVLDQLRAAGGQVRYLRPALAWLGGWLTEQQGSPERALEIYAGGEDTASGQSPVYTARLLLAHGRLLRRTGNRKDAVERLRRARALFAALRAAPFTERAEQELAACHLPANPAKKQSVLALTSRETEVAHLVGQGLSSPEIAGELSISRKAVGYHLGNIYAKYGLQGRQQLRRVVAQWREPTAV